MTGVRASVSRAIGIRAGAGAVVLPRPFASVPKVGRRRARRGAEAGAGEERLGLTRLSVATWFSDFDLDDGASSRSDRPTDRRRHRAPGQRLAVGPGDAMKVQKEGKVGMLGLMLLTEPDQKFHMSVDDRLGRVFAEQATFFRPHALEFALDLGRHRFDRGFERLRVHATLLPGSRSGLRCRVGAIVSGQG